MAAAAAISAASKKLSRETGTIARRASQLGRGSPPSLLLLSPAYCTCATPQPLAHATPRVISGIRDTHAGATRIGHLLPTAICLRSRADLHLRSRAGSCCGLVSSLVFFVNCGFLRGELELGIFFNDRLSSCERTIFVLSQYS